jgi:3-oxoacyl-[acyl-carrier-protein] synthase II
MRSKNNLLGGEKAPLAITGCGITSAAGLGLEALARALKERRSCLGPIDRLRAPCFQTPVGGEVREEWLDGSGGEASAGGDRAWRLARSALDEALAGAGLADEAQASAPIGLALGTALGPVEEMERWVARRGEGEKNAVPAPCSRRSADLVPRSEILQRLSFEALAARLAEEARPALRGPRSVFSATCVSGLCAIEQAAADLARGRAGAMAAGAVDTLSRFMQAGFSALGALSPSGRLRPFDLEHDGIVLGEAAAFLVLEPLRAAAARGARASACLASQRLESDAFHLTSPEPSGKGMARAITRALGDAGLGAGDIGCITVSATGSPVYDRMLSRAVRQALGDDAAGEIPVTTWEPAVGHVLAATSIVGIAHAALTIREGRVLPVFGIERLDPECRLRYAVGEPLALRTPVVLALLVGFGGQNGAAVVVGPEVAADLEMGRR